MSVYSEELTAVILSNQNLIHSLAKKYDYQLWDDLFQVGVMGMIDAYNHFDPTMNTKFTSFAYSYIDGEMKKFVREDRNIKVSRDIVYLAAKIERAKDLLRQRLHKEPSITELSTFLEIDEAKIVEALQSNNYIKSIDEPINDGGRELTIKDVVGSGQNSDLLDLISLREELQKLSPKDKEIIERRYLEERTQCETADLMGISQVDVSRTERKLILSLRNKLQ